MTTPGRIAGDTASDESTGKALGGRIRALRRLRGMTLVRLASLSALSHSFLSQVERGQATPSFNSLGRIAHALGTSQIELLTDSRPAGSVGHSRVTAAAEAAQGTYGEGEARLLVADADAHFRPLSITSHHLEFGEPFVHVEHEFLYLVAGRIEVELDGERQVLEPGDSVYCESEVPHRWRAVDPGGFHALVVKEQPRTTARQPRPAPTEES
ncbi:helix-turn-helix domain-containing protein [Demequina aurantiaca]|uniref:helix-turn-helix domain-containing protein n=1 Tax=Demequina aurantiaca TaxID=676200 RepID=UPI003D356F25